MSDPVFRVSQKTYDEVVLGMRSAGGVPASFYDLRDFDSSHPWFMDRSVVYFGAVRVEIDPDEPDGEVSAYGVDEQTVARFRDFVKFWVVSLGLPTR